MLKCWEFGVSRCKLLHIEWINKVLVYSTENYVQYPGINHMDVQAPLSMRFPRQGYWSGLSLPSPKYLPHPGIEPRAPTLGGGFFTPEPKCLLNRSLVVRDGENYRNY